MKKTVQRILMTIAYMLIALFGVLSGMFSESLIGSTHPMADVLASVITWFGLVVALSPAVCLLTANSLREKPVVRRVVLVLPFVLLALQLLLGYIAEML